MRPKGKLFALFAVFAAIGLVTASGAFTTVQAERTAEVNAAGDANALLQIQAADGPNGNQYVNNASVNAQTVELVLESDNGNNGINNNATTEVDNVLNITNQGTQSVRIYLETTGTHEGVVTFTAQDTTSNIPDKNITERDRLTSSLDSGNSVQIGTGETVVISMTMDTNGVELSNDQDILSDVTIYANATSASP